MQTFKGRPIVPGSVQAQALVTHSGFHTLASYQKCLTTGDKSGKCSDSGNKELYRRPMAGMALCLPRITGSAADMVLYTAACMNRQPACMLFSGPIDSQAAAGAILARVWSETVIPAVDCLGEDFLDTVRDGDQITVSEDGTVTVQHSSTP